MPMITVLTWPNPVLCKWDRSTSSSALSSLARRRRARGDRDSPAKAIGTGPSVGGVDHEHLDVRSQVDIAVRGQRHSDVSAIRPTHHYHRLRGRRNDHVALDPVPRILLESCDELAFQEIVEPDRLAVRLTPCRCGIGGPRG